MLKDWFYAIRTFRSPVVKPNYKGRDTWDESMVDIVHCSTRMWMRSGDKISDEHHRETIMLYKKGDRAYTSIGYVQIRADDQKYFIDEIHIARRFRGHKLSAIIMCEAIASCVDDFSKYIRTSTRTNPLIPYTASIIVNVPVRQKILAQVLQKYQFEYIGRDKFGKYMIHTRNIEYMETMPG